MKKPLFHTLVLFATTLFASSAAIAVAVAEAPTVSKATAYALLVFSEPVKGKEAQYSAWYDEVHVPALLAVPGFVAAERYQSVKADTPDSKLPPYVAFYQVKSTDWAATDAAVKRDFAAGKIRSSLAFNQASSATVVYQTLGPFVHAKDVPGASAPTQIAGKTELRTYAMFVSMNAAEGKDEAFNRWYDQQHMPDVLRIPGFLSGQRYKLVKNDSGEASAGKSMDSYMVWFNFQSYDLEATIADLKNRVKTGVTIMTDSFGKGGHVYYLTPLPKVLIQNDPNAVKPSLER